MIQAVDPLRRITSCPLQLRRTPSACARFTSVSMTPSRWSRAASRRRQSRRCWMTRPHLLPGRFAKSRSFSAPPLGDPPRAPEGINRNPADCPALALCCNGRTTPGASWILTHRLSPELAPTLAAEMAAIGVSLPRSAGRSCGPIQISSHKALIHWNLWTVTPKAQRLHDAVK